MQRSETPCGWVWSARPRAGARWQRSPNSHGTTPVTDHTLCVGRSGWRVDTAGDVRQTADCHGNGLHVSEPASSLPGTRGRWFGCGSVVLGEERVDDRGNRRRERAAGHRRADGAADLAGRSGQPHGQEPGAELPAREVLDGRDPVPGAPDDPGRAGRRVRVVVRGQTGPRPPRRGRGRPRRGRRLGRRRGPVGRAGGPRRHRADSAVRQARAGSGGGAAEPVPQGHPGVPRPGPVGDVRRVGHAAVAGRGRHRVRQPPAAGAGRVRLCRGEGHAAAEGRRGRSDGEPRAGAADAGLRGRPADRGGPAPA